MGIEKAGALEKHYATTRASTEVLGEVGTDGSAFVSHFRILKSSTKMAYITPWAKTRHDYSIRKFTYISRPFRSICMVAASPGFNCLKAVRSSSTLRICFRFSE